MLPQKFSINIFTIFDSKVILIPKQFIGQMSEDSRDRYSDEVELIRLLHKGDEGAFEFLFRKYFTCLCNFAEHFVKDDKTAENIVEDLFCDLWEHSHNLSINHSLQGYLFKSVF